MSGISADFLFANTSLGQPGIHNPFSKQIYITNYVPPSGTVVQRGVQWYTEKLWLPQMVKKILFASVSIFASIATIGLFVPVALHLHHIYQRQKTEKAAAEFLATVKGQVEKGEKHPPSDAPIVLKSPTRAFNHVNDYAIEDGVVWYRRRNDPQHKWEPLFFDGIPESISVDGANLTIRDNTGMVHYRKVLLERGKALEIAKKDFIARSNVEGIENAYFAVDLSQKVNWYRSWYNMPVVGRVVSFLCGHSIHAVGSISHRSSFSRHFTDANGQDRIASVGVTTYYELEQGNHSIRLHDPYLPGWAPLRIPLPETETTVFVAKNLDASASSLLAIGYDVNEKEHSGSLKILTKFFDADSEGANYFIPIVYQSSAGATEPKKKVLRALMPSFFKQAFPDVTEGVVLADEVANEGWVEHPLPQEAGVLYNQVTILATGPHHTDREMRVAGTTKDGRNGHFFKKITDKQWDFEENATVDTSSELRPTIHSAEASELARGIRRTHVYSSKPTGRVAQKVSSVSLSNFGRGFSFHPSIRVNFQNRLYILPLHRKLGLLSLVGTWEETYDLVLSKNDIQDDDPLFEAFGQRRVVPVRIESRVRNGKEEAVIRISGKHPPIPPLLLD